MKREGSLIPKKCQMIKSKENTKKPSFLFNEAKMLIVHLVTLQAFFEKFPCHLPSQGL